MNRFLLLLLLHCSVAITVSAQYVYTIKADSVKITNSCDTAELIIENHTQNVPGFLFNKGRGRTEFRKGMLKLNDSLYLLGADTLNLNDALNSLIANNGLLKTGRTIQFGNDANNPTSGPANQIRSTFYNQNNQLFNWMTGSSQIFTVSKFQYATSETSVLRDYHIARFAASGQGGLLIEATASNPWSAPVNWIFFKNNHPNAVRSTFYGDPYSGVIELGQRQGTDGKYYSMFHFSIAGDSANIFENNNALRLYPRFTAQTGGPIKIPTAVVQRLDITDPVPGAGDNFFPLSYNNPYSRLVVEAKNIPIVIANLPKSSTDGHLLVVDSVGKVWRGDSTSILRSLPGKVKITADLTSSSSTVADASGLSFAVTAGTYYKYKFIIVFSSDNTATGIKLGLTYPAATVASATADITNAADGVSSKYHGAITASGDVVMSQGVEAANTNYIAVVEGVILPTASGTLQLTFGTGVNGSTVTVKNGSMGLIETY